MMIVYSYPTVTPIQAPHKVAFEVITPTSEISFSFHKLPYGGPGGIRTPVQNTFLFASYSNNSHCTTRITCCQLNFCPLANNISGIGIHYFCIEMDSVGGIVFLDFDWDY